MEKSRPTLLATLIKTIVVHTVTYFVVGVIVFNLFDYPVRFAEPGVSSLMRQTDDPLVIAGVLFQPIRGLLFGIVFYLLRDVFFVKKHGWLTMWVVLVVLGIFSTFGPASGSIEGMIYTKLPIGGQLFGLIEILAQSLLLAVVTFYWVTHPEQRWISWLLVGLFVIIILLATLGLLMGGSTVSLKNRTPRVALVMCNKGDLHIQQISMLSPLRARNGFTGQSCALSHDCPVPSSWSANGG